MRRILVGLLLVGALSAPGIRAVSALRNGDSPTTVYIVRSGDTLWSIARSHGLEGDRRAAVERVMELNRLRSAIIVPGQTLRLPLV